MKLTIAPTTAKRTVLKISSEVIEGAMLSNVPLAVPMWRPLSDSIVVGVLIV